MKGPRTRAAIIDAAGNLFSTKGYAATSLEEIGAQLGVSRGTVLFHFETKLALLFAVVEPLYADVETMVRGFEKYPAPLPGRQRRAFLTRYAEILSAHPYAMRLLVRDLSSITQLNVPVTGPAITDRLMTLLQGSEPDAAMKLRTSAALGTILRPIAVPAVEIDDEARAVLVECALAAYASKG